MSVDLGKPKTALMGKSATTKRIESGFTLTVGLDRDRLFEVIHKFCEAYPKKKGVFGIVNGAMLFVRRSDKARLIGFGTITNGTIMPDWSLALVGATPAYRLELVQARLVSGLVAEVKELQRFLNALEEELRLVDATARITLR